MSLTVGLKIDVDTDRGTRIGVPNLLRLLNDFNIRATFLFSLGPDNTGQAIKRVFRPGFLRKVQRTNVISLYGWRTLLNGTVLPAPHIARKNASIMRQVRDEGHGVGIHCYDHILWQDTLHRMSFEETAKEFEKAYQEFKKTFGCLAHTAGAAGWQADEKSFEIYDHHKLKYGSDTRGSFPFYPQIGARRFQTLQLPTTLPTLDELMGRPDFPESHLVAYYINLLKGEHPNILTLHAEIEGMKKLSFFQDLLTQWREHNVLCIPLEKIADKFLENTKDIPYCLVKQGEIEGRSGKVALQDVGKVF